MSKRKKIIGTTVAVLGYVLSPLSWWNDIFVNIPLAYVFSIPFVLISRELFMPAFIVGYWLTNLLGFVLLHHGLVYGYSTAELKKGKREIKKDILVSVAYTAIVIILVSVGVIEAPHIGGH